MLFSSPLLITDTRIEESYEGQRKAKRFAIKNGTAELVKYETSKPYDNAKPVYTYSTYIKPTSKIALLYKADHHPRQPRTSPRQDQIGCILGELVSKLWAF